MEKYTGHIKNVPSFFYFIKVRFDIYAVLLYNINSYNNVTQE